MQVIKFIRANLMLGWLQRRSPEVNIILLLRHPFAVADSSLRQGWTMAMNKYLEQPNLFADYLAGSESFLNGLQDDFERHIAAWCIETLVPLTQLRDRNVLFAIYEKLRDDPQLQLTTLLGHLGITFGQEHKDLIDEPSPVSSEESRSALARGENPAHRWQARISQQQRQRGWEIITYFGLAGLFDASGQLTLQNLVPLQQQLRSIFPLRKGRWETDS